MQSNWKEQYKKCFHYSPARVIVTPPRKITLAMKCSLIMVGSLEVCDVHQIEMVGNQKCNQIPPKYAGNNGDTIYKPEEATYEHPISER